MPSAVAIYAFALVMIGFTALILAGVAGLILGAIAKLARRGTPAGLLLLAFVAAVVVTVVSISFIIFLWALAVFFTGAFATIGDAMTFAVDNFTTLGSMGGLPAPWKILGPIIAVNGMLIFGITAAILVAVMLAVYREEVKELGS